MNEIPSLLSYLWERCVKYLHSFLCFCVERWMKYLANYLNYLQISGFIHLFCIERRIKYSSAIINGERNVWNTLILSIHTFVFVLNEYLFLSYLWRDLWNTTFNSFVFLLFSAHAGNFPLLSTLSIQSTSFKVSPASTLVKQKHQALNSLLPPTKSHALNNLLLLNLVKQ